jgi:DNA polymerase III delta subunit
VILIQNKSLGKSKAANSLKNDYDVIKLDKPTAAEVKTFIKTKLESFGRLYNSEVIDCIYKKRDNDLYGIASDLEKIKHYCRGKDVTLRDCDLLVEDNSYKTFFSLTEKVMLLSKKELFRDLSKFSETEYIPIVTTIIKSLDKLYKVLCLREEGKDLEEIAVLTGTPKFILKTKFVPNINILGRKGILYMKDNLLKLDVRLRSSKLDKRLIMESGLIKCFPAKV